MTRLAQIVGTVFGAGYLRPAPGTWGSLAALPLAWALHVAGGFPLLVMATAAVFILGVWATTEMTEGRDNHDPSEIVIDEVAGQFIALLPLSSAAGKLGIDITVLWPGWVAAFVLFRLFDIWKPGPIGWADRRGDPLGVMLDDIIAGAFAALGVLALAWVAHGLMGGMNVAAILDRARAAAVRIATAESCTGGMVAAALTDIPGSSDVVECGFVTYSNAAKRDMLGVRAATLEAHGAVSEAVAREMADGALARSQAHLAVAITGIAGPGGSGFKPEGRVCFGLAARGRGTITETVEFGAIGRANVRAAARDHALRLLDQGVSGFTRVPGN